MGTHAISDAPEFAGAKLILLIGGQLLVIRRDDRGDIPWPGRLDFPGGGREGAEDALACALRETREEVGLVVSRDHVTWQAEAVRPQGRVWYFGADLPADWAGRIVFGDEGQGWGLMPPAAYAAHPLAIPHFADRLADFLRDRGRG